MKFNKIKSAFLLALMTVLLAPMAWGFDNYYAKLTTKVATSGGGKVYAANNGTENVNNYSVEGNTAQSSGGNSSGTSRTLYAYAFPDFGYEFTEWSTSASSTSHASYDAKWTATLNAGTDDDADGTKNYTYYAHFATAVVKDIFLCVGDTATFYFYNATSKKFTSAYNSAFVTGTTAVGGNGASCKVYSTDNTQGYNVLITTTRASGTADTLTVMDWQGNTYNYRIHVSAARVFDYTSGTEVPNTTNHTCAAFATRTWTATGDDASGTTATASGATVTIGASASGTHTVTMSNANKNGTTTGALGAEYKLQVTVNKQTQTLGGLTVLAGEDAVVDPSLFGGAAWSFAKSTATGTATVPNTSDAAGTGVTVHGVKVGDTTITFETADTVYTVPVTVQAKPVVNLTTRFTCVGESVDIPSADFGGLAWKNANSDDTSKGLLSATSGAAGTGVTVQGLNPGETLVTFETATAKYQAHVQVNSKAQIDLGTVQVRAGATLAITDARITGAWKGAASANTGKVTVDAGETGAAGTGPTVTGVAETDETGVVVTFNDAKRVYTVHVQVFDKYRYDCGVKTVVPPPRNAGGTSFESPALIPVNPAWGSGYAVTIGDTSVATFEQTTEGIVVHGLPQGTQDNGAATTLTVTTDDATYTYTLYVVSDEVHEVHFCEGDKTQIWYNDTTGSDTWFLLINDARYELDQRGEGEQMHVTLTAQDEQISYIIATADTVGDPEHGDLVVISDGVKYYTYRMSCSPERVVEVGASTNMVCRTVAVNKWRVDYMSDQWGYTNFIDVACSPNESGDASHFTTATITGRAIAGETYVLVRDDQHRAEEHNAQGAVYTLKTRVVGAPEIPVYLSAGVSADVSWENWSDPSATLTVEGTGDTVAILAAFQPGGDTGDHFVLNISTTESAQPGQTATYLVKAGGVTLAKYVCTMSQTFAVKEGTFVPGYLYGVNDTPWVSVSLNPSVATVTPTKYNRMYSAEARFKQEGIVEFHSTNAYYQAGYYFVKATVYDTHITDIDMTAGSTTTVLVTHNGSFAGTWTWSADNTNLLAGVTLTPDPNDPMKVTAAITAKSGVKGAVNVTVTSGYHQETIRVYVSPDDGRQKVRINGEITLVVGMEQELPAEATANGWTSATSMNTDLVTVSPASGNPGERATISGVSAGTTTIDGKSTSQTTVVVENETTVYIYTVSVVKPTTESLDLGVINVGETRTMNRLSELFEGEIQSIAALDGNLTLEVNWDKANDRTITTGNQEGETTIVVKTDTHIYNLHVKVRKNHIDKHIKLAIGEDGSKTTYSFTFDRLEDISPDYIGKFSVTTNGGVVTYAKKNNRYYSIERTGNKVTFIPGEIEFLDDTNDTVVFLGQVDGLAFTTELHYWVMVEKAPNDQRVIQKEGVAGYIGYEGTDDVHVDPETGDIILVFTNANEVGSISVPSPWNVKMDILAIGGGGAGGSGDREGHNGGGGGAGGFTYVSNRVLVAGSFGVVVGKAGTSGVGAMPGLNGFPSALTNAFGYAIASATGGGGGGAMSGYAESINGLDGGSGGGAAWNNVAPGTGGSGDGEQGYSGSASATRGGGGGGGAGGPGGGTPSAGAYDAGGIGRASDISGATVMYAVGGNGGEAGKVARGAAGNGPGFGGAGGSGAQGGDGADGIVIIRIKDIYRNIKVPLPGPESIPFGDQGYLLETQMVSNRFVWTEWYDKSDPCVAFEYEGKEFRSSTDAKPKSWNDAIASVTGTTSVKCSSAPNILGEPEKVGVGYYSFTIRLKEGYAWEDGLGDETYGDTSPKVYRWAIVESEDVTTASINIHKTVEWSTPSNATVNVTTFTSPETSGGKTPEVLFLAGMCGYHSQQKQTVINAINAVAKKANIDYYMLPDTYQHTEDSIVAGHLDIGGKLANTVLNPAWEDSNNHFIVDKMINTLYDRIVPGSPNYKQYDYIVFEFDGNTMAASRNTTGANALLTLVQGERPLAVASALLPFYEDNSVIWIIPASTSNVTKNDPFVSAGFPYFQASSYYIDLYNTGGSSLAEGPFYALASVLDPKAVIYGDNPSEIGYAGSRTYTGGGVTRKTAYQTTRTASSRTYYLLGNARDDDHQVFYDNSENVERVLEAAIKVKPFNLNLRDKIQDGDSGLTIDTVSIVACTNSVDGAASTDPDDWTEVMKWHMDTSNMEWMDREGKSGIKGGWMNVDASSNLVEAVISNVDITVWTKLKIGIVDDGRFRTSEGANYNEHTGQWEKNPNDGTAFAGMEDELGHALNIEGEAETETPWVFNAYIITTETVNGKAFVQGRDIDRLEIGENNNCTVYYRGYGGYKLVEVIVDNETPVDLQAHPSSYTFENVTANHSIRIVYEPFITEVTSTPVTNVYDGVVFPFDVNVAFVTNAQGQAQSHPLTEVRFATLDVLSDPALYNDDANWLKAEDFVNYYSTNALPQWVDGELTDVGDHEFAYRVYARQPGYGTEGDAGDEGWVWVQISNDETDHSVILPRPLYVRPNDSALIYSTNDLPHIDFTVTGFREGEDLAVIGEEAVTNGWWVTSTYSKGMGMGLYPTWVVDANANAVWEGKSDHITPLPAIDKNEGLYNFGNYYLVIQQNGQPVEKLPIEIGDVLQVPGLIPGHDDTGVDPVVKLYDGVLTNLVVDVTSINPSNDTTMAINTDYTITYALADPNDPSRIISDPSGTNPTRLHAGTNLVWYLVEPQGLMTNVYFAASNYQYVVVNPRQLVLESPSATWKFDGTMHELDVVTEAAEGSDGVAPTDTLTTNAVGKILHVGTVENTIEYELTGTCEPGDYIVTTRPGELAVTPRYMVIGGEDYDPTDRENDPNMPTVGWHSGAVGAEKVYDGIGTNIIVRVDVPEDDTRFRILYTTNFGDTAWSETNPVLTNVTDMAVWFAVEAIGEWSGDYVAVTNYARVVITPRTAQVTANEATTSVGATIEPPYTATVTGDFAAKDVGHEYELIHWDAISTTNFSDCVKAEGTYEGVVVPTGVVTQGNYVVTYLPGNLVVIEKQIVYTLWITDHADAGDGLVHLAFKPTLARGEVTAEVIAEWGVNNAIKVKCAATEAALAEAALQPIVELRNGTGTQSLDKGWVWITVKVPDGAETDTDGAGLAWKIVITAPTE